MIAALIVAAGSSSRMGGGIKKEYRELPAAPSETGGAPASPPLTVLRSAFLPFAENKRISLIIVAHPLKSEIGESAARAAIGEEAIKLCGKPVYFVPGGATRRLSVHHGLALLSVLWGERNSGQQSGYVLIHDGARPWVGQALIDRVIDAAVRHGAAIPVLPLTDTPKILDEAGTFIQGHPKRSTLALSQTPQGFQFEKILAAHEKAAEEELACNVEWTDDAEIYGAFSGPVAVVPGDRCNKKITFASDAPRCAAIRNTEK